VKLPATTSGGAGAVRPPRLHCRWREGSARKFWCRLGVLWWREEVRHGRNLTGKGRTVSSAATLPMACRWGSGWSRMASVARRPRKTNVDRLLPPSLYPRLGLSRRTHALGRAAGYRRARRVSRPTWWTRWTRRAARRTGGGSTERERSTTRDSGRPYTGRPHWRHVGRRMDARAHARAQRRDSRHPF
jgi:hypothetical protein